MTIYNQHILDWIEEKGTISTNQYMKGFIDDPQYMKDLRWHNERKISELKCVVDGVIEDMCS
ncbi:hypothetical protein [Vibrio phage LP.2]|nr:hypothetical protein [Vibrio phage LP.2]